MKKSLFALAAVGAFAGAAQAQSSVTVYGILDVGFQGISTRGPVSSANQTNTTTNINRFSGEGSESTSRLGFRGTEDLGGGTRAFFTAEFQLNATDATLSGSTGNGLFNRQTFVGIGQKGIGQAAIGTQYTPVHVAVGRTDPGQQNNMLGNVIYATNASQGSGQTTAAYTVRYNNALTFQSDRFAGFVVSAIYNQNSQTANNTSAVTAAGINNTGPSSATAFSLAQSQANNKAWGLGVNYVIQKLNVDLAYQASRNDSVAGGVYTTAALPAAAAANALNTPANPLGTNIQFTQMYAGAVYDFGILKAYAQYVSNKATSNFNSSLTLERSAQQLGVRGNITKTVEGWASIGNGSFKGNGTAISAGMPTANFTGYQVGSNYWLSKRTNMYAIFGSTQVSTASSTVPSEGGSSYGIGVRHTF
jgi:predicted porin